MTNSNTRRTRQQQSELRGFPSEEALHDLAEMYLQLCVELYPDLVADGTLPKPGESSIEDFTETFTKTWDANQYAKPTSTRRRR